MITYQMGWQHQEEPAEIRLTGVEPGLDSF